MAQGLVADLDISEQHNPFSRLWTEAINDVETQRQTGSAWGYHVGTDVAVPVARNVSVGVLARYSKANISVEDPVLSLIRDRSVPTSLDAGGLQMMGGIRVRF